MPIYEYQCKSCGNEYEAFQRISDEGRPPCDHCGSGEVQRLVSLSAFHLKGNGWYVTDYKGKNAGNTPAKSEGGESTSDGAGSASESASESGPPSAAASPRAE